MKEPMKCEQKIKDIKHFNFASETPDICGGELEYKSVFVASIDFKSKKCVYRGTYQCAKCKDIKII